jgi:chitodextrinase
MSATSNSFKKVGGYPTFFYFAFFCNCLILLLPQSVCAAVLWDATQFYRMGSHVQYYLDDKTNIAALSWVSTSKYGVGEKVIYGGAVWQAQVANVGTQPGLDGNWSSVTKSIDYIALANNLGKPPPASPNYWVSSSQYSSRHATSTETPYIQPPTQPLNDTSSNANLNNHWISSVIYNSGNVVQYAGATWRANFWTQGDAPGVTDAWLPTSLTKWYPRVAYVKGATALDKGLSYTAQWWVQGGSTPSLDTSGAWKLSNGASSSVDKSNQITSSAASKAGNLNSQTPISTPQPTLQVAQPFVSSTQQLEVSAYPSWSANSSYKINDRVSHLAAVWQKITPNDNRAQPSSSADWQPLTATAWYPAVPYAKGIQVLIGSQLYFPQWWNLGVDPRTDSSGVWVMVDSAGNRIYTNPSSSWIGTRVYVSGDQCMYNNTQWLSVYWNQNETPGTTGAWVPKTITNWYAGVAYAPSISGRVTTVIFDGIQWKANGWTQGEQPGAGPSWTPLGQAQWYSALAYASGAKVTFGGVTWIALYWTQGNQPGTHGAWKPATTTQWYQAVSYNAGDQITYSGVTWQAQAPNSGAQPGSVSHWIPLTKPSITAPWVSAFSYNVGEKVLYEGVTWQALSSNQNLQPGASSVWKPLSTPPWSMASAYTAGERATFNGVSWQAQWWTQGNQPGTNAVWMPLETTQWYAVLAYQAGKRASYAGSIWEAQWWTQGNIPGDSSGVWKKIEN